MDTLEFCVNMTEEGKNSIFSVSGLYRIVLSVFKKVQMRALDKFFDGGAYSFAKWDDLQCFSLENGEFLRYLEAHVSGATMGCLSNIDDAVKLISSNKENLKRTQEKFDSFNRFLKKLVFEAEQKVYFWGASREAGQSQHTRNKKKGFVDLVPLTVTALVVMKALYDCSQRNSHYAVFA